MIGKNVELFEVPVASYDGRQREADQGIVWIRGYPEATLAKPLLQVPQGSQHAGEEIREPEFGEENRSGALDPRKPGNIRGES